MAKSIEKLNAYRLRRKGKSLGDIATRLGVSKSTVSLWCKDIELSSTQIEKLHRQQIQTGLKGRLMAVESNKRKKAIVIENCKIEAEKEIGILSERDLLLLSIGLYWAEGSKGYNFSFVNSDPKIISLFIQCLTKVFHVAKEDLVLRVAVNESHRSRNDKILKFWSNLLQLSRKQFRKTTFIKTLLRKRYENHETYFGTLTVRVARSKRLFYKLIALIKVVSMPV